MRLMLFILDAYNQYHMQLREEGRATMLQPLFVLDASKDEKKMSHNSYGELTVNSSTIRSF